MPQKPSRLDLMQYLYCFVGKWYKWGGENPMEGFDCSGFAIEYLKSWGELPRRFDCTADDLYIKYYEWIRLDDKTAKPGDLVFWVNSKNKAYHVEICIDLFRSIGASGGGSKTLTIKDAMRDNAFIKIRPFNNRGSNYRVCDPFKGQDYIFG